MSADRNVCVDRSAERTFRVHKKKEKHFIYFNAFHTEIKFPDRLGKALFWEMLATLH